MLTSNYGIVTKTQIDDFVATWIGNNDHDCQNSFNSSTCLIGSLTEEAQARVNLERNTFINDKSDWGPQLLHTIIDKAAVQNKGTQMMQLPKYMVDIAYNIKTFNKHVQELQMVRTC